MNIGIVGLGQHGRTHAEIVDDLGHTVVGADASAETRRMFQREFDAKTVGSPDTLFQRELDAAIITTPNKFHETAALSAFDEGIDVLIEKPLAHSLESARRIVDRADERDCICMCGFNYRFQRKSGILSEYASDGEFGQVDHVDGSFVRVRGIPGRGTWYTSADIAGGGALLDIGCHVVHLVLTLLDWPDVSSLEASVETNFGHRDDYEYIHMYGEDDHSNIFDVEDTARAFLTFDSGQTASIEVAWAANSEARHRYEVHGDEQGAELDLTNPVGESTRNQLTFRSVSGRGESHFIDSSVTAPSVHSYRVQAEEFLAAVREERQPRANSADEALAVQRTIDRIYEASDGD
jgi:predicted dehydrogenase